jgi:Flp pilus assembly protein TadG
VETVIWLPFLFLILAMITDASLAFFSKVEAQRVVQNANRLYSLRALSTTAQVEEFAVRWFRNTAINATARTVTSPPVTTTHRGTLVGTQLRYPMQNVMLFSDVPNDWMITVESVHYVEWPQP